MMPWVALLAAPSFRTFFFQTSPAGLYPRKTVPGLLRTVYLRA